jgi:hypothetical protein
MMVKEANALFAKQALSAFASSESGGSENGNSGWF